jgi:hypothetical protein
MFKAANSPVLISLSTALFASYLFYAWTVTQRQAGSWGCEMSWMLPSYLPIQWEDKPNLNYDLYLYREQEWDRELTVRDTKGALIFSSPQVGRSSSSQGMQGHINRSDR